MNIFLKNVKSNNMINKDEKIKSISDFNFLFSGKANAFKQLRRISLKDSD